MRKFIITAIALLLVLGLLSVGAGAYNAVETPEALTAEEQLSLNQAAEAIKSTYGVDAALLFNRQTESSAESVGDFIQSNGFRSGYLVLGIGAKYYDYEWSDDLTGIFTDADLDNIVNTILCYNESATSKNVYDISTEYFAMVSDILAERTIQSDCRYVQDRADILSDAQEKELDSLLSAFRAENRFDLVVVTVTGLRPSDRMAYADDYYDSYGYGYGDGYDGALLLVNVNEDGTYATGNSWISTCGRGLDVLSDDDISAIGAELTPLLLKGDYNGAFALFPSLVKDCMQSYKNGNIGLVIFVTVIVSVIIAFIYAGSLKRDLKSVQQATEADNYIVGNSLKLNRAYDRFLYRRVTKTPRQSSNGGRSSGSHTSSSGRSHGGGGF